MKTYSQFINESFDTRAKWRESRKGDSTIFTAIIDGKEVILRIEDDILESVFISFTVDGGREVSGTGAANRIFGAVINKIAEYVDEHKPIEISFMAAKHAEETGREKTSRISLYKRMLKRKFTRTNYEVETHMLVNVMIFILKREGQNTIDEAFDTRVRWRESKTKDGDHLFSANIDGKSVMLFFDLIVGDNIEPVVDIHFTVDGSHDVTGGGSQYKIFGAVINMILEYVDEHKPKRLTFIASKETDAPNVRSMSRARLYNRLVRKFARNDYEVKITHGEYEDDFQFILRDNNNEKFRDLRDRRK